MLKILILPLFITLNCLAQNEGNTWYFGDGAGINFNSGEPVVILDSEMTAQEGCSSISDTGGNLLFYTNGISVWNRMHEVMPNGAALMGHFSSSQSALILPKPGSKDLFYLFTTDGYGGLNGLGYSIIDMSLDGGFGDVTEIKDSPVKNEVAEKLTVVRHHNGLDYWVIVRAFNSSEYYSFLFTSSGLNETPIISDVGRYIGGEKSKTIGCLKSSIDGTKIAAAIWDNDLVEVFDFDNRTGRLSIKIELNNFYLGQPYGVEFSPSGNVLYVSEANNESFSNLYQYNLTLIDEDLINERRELISRVLPKSGALQLGPDLKIYMAKMEHGFLSAIHQPERLGEACEYIQNAVDLMGKTSKLGLPNLFSIDFISPYVGIEENLTLGVKVYPNPSNGAFKYSLTNNESNVRIQVYSLDGKSIQIKSHQSFGNNGQFTIDQKAGVYLLELACNEDVYRTKIVIE